MAGQPLRDGGEDHVQLDQRGAAEAVDHHQSLAGQGQVGVDRLQRDRRDLLRRYQLPTGTPGLPVDTHAQLDLILAQFEAGLSGRRYRAGRQRHAEGPRPLVDLTTEGHGRSEVGAALGRRSHDLLHEHGRAGTPPPRRPGAVLHRHVVVDHHGLDPYPVVGGQLRGHLEVQDVPGVVLDDVQDPGAPVHGLGSGQDLVRYRRGEHLARAGRVEHPVPHKAAVQRLVPGPAAGHQAHLARRRPTGPRDVPVCLVHRQVRMCRSYPGERVDQHLIRCVNQFLHVSSSLARIGYQEGTRTRSGAGADLTAPRKA